MSRKHRIGIVGHTDELRIFCEKSLGLVAKIEFYDAFEAVFTPLNDSLLLFIIDEPHPEHTAALAKCIKINPDLPILVMGGDFSPNQAVELVQCGACDFLSLPAKPVEIRLKVERHLRGRRGPVFSDSVLMPFEPTSGRLPLPYMGSNRRLCYRASVINDAAIRVQITVDSKPYFLEIVELSVVTERRPGGILLRPALKPPPLDAENTDTEVQLSAAHMQRDKRISKDVETLPVPWQDLEVGAEFECEISLPTAVHRTIPTRVKVVFAKPHKRKALKSRIAVQYFPKNMADDKAFREFWMLCQRSETALP